MVRKIEIVLDIEDGKTDETIKNNTKGYNVVKYLDITLYKSVDGVNESIHELSNVLKITLSVSKELKNTDNKIKREYYIARNYNGKVDILEAKYDEKASTLTFETDRFSDYAILYKDTKLDLPKEDTSKNEGIPQETIIPNVKEETSQTKVNKQKEANKVKTGDETNILGITVLLLCSLGILVLLKRKTEER